MNTCWCVAPVDSYGDLGAVVNTSFHLAWNEPPGFLLRSSPLEFTAIGEQPRQTHGHGRYPSFQGRSPGGCTHQHHTVQPTRSLPRHFPVRVHRRGEVEERG